MNNPRSAREALVAELLGELDALLQRVEALPGTLDIASQRITAAVAALEAAGNRYRAAITDFNQQAQAELNDFMDQHTAQFTHRAAQTLAAQQRALQAAALQALRTTRPAQQRWQDLAAHVLTALIASGCTGALLILWLRHA